MKETNCLFCSGIAKEVSPNNYYCGHCKTWFKIEKPAIGSGEKTLVGESGLRQLQTSQEAVFNKLTKVEQITYKVLERNPVLRLLKFRNLLTKVVSAIYGEELSGETVPRAARVIQNTFEVFKVEDTADLERIFREYYSQ